MSPEGELQEPRGSSCRALEGVVAERVEELLSVHADPLLEELVPDWLFLG
jgi:hypothetical protein